MRLLGCWAEHPTVSTSYFSPPPFLLLLLRVINYFSRLLSLIRSLLKMLLLGCWAVRLLGCKAVRLKKVLLFCSSPLNYTTGSVDMVYKVCKLFSLGYWSLFRTHEFVKEVLLSPTAQQPYSLTT